MYLLAGHFSYLEYAVAERSFPFVGQMANLARLTANNARSRCLSIEQDLALDTSNRDGEGVQLGDDYFGDVNCTPSYGPEHIHCRTMLIE